MINQELSTWKSNKKYAYIRQTAISSYKVFKYKKSNHIISPEHLTQGPMHQNPKKVKTEICSQWQCSSYHCFLGCCYYCNTTMIVHTTKSSHWLICSMELSTPYSYYLSIIASLSSIVLEYVIKNVVHAIWILLESIFTN